MTATPCASGPRSSSRSRTTRSRRARRIARDSRSASPASRRSATTRARPRRRRSPSSGHSTSASSRPRDGQCRILAHGRTCLHRTPEARRDAGRRPAARDVQVPTADGGVEFDWNWKATYNHALYTVRPFVYFHFAAGTRRVVVDGVEPMDAPADSIQFFVFDELYRKTIHRDAETLGMEICLPVWKHRAFIDAHRYDHARITTLLLVTTEETRLEDLLARKVATGDLGATANTIVARGSERVGNRLARMLCVVKHRGSAKSDEIVEFRIGANGLEM